MRYGKDIVKRIVEELHKIPSVRQVSQKVGIDRSTLYRWMSKHYEFSQAVEDALIIGRENINDMARCSIINLIQEGNFYASKYWLSRHDTRFVEAKEMEYFQAREQKLLIYLQSKSPEDSPFESLFRHYFLLDQLVGEKNSKQYIHPKVRLRCQSDEQLMEIFYSSYAEWKEKILRDRKNLQELVVQPKEIEELLEDIRPSDERKTPEKDYLDELEKINES